MAVANEPNVTRASMSRSIRTGMLHLRQAVGCFADASTTGRCAGIPLRTTEAVIRAVDALTEAMEIEEGKLR